MFEAEGSPEAHRLTRLPQIAILSGLIGTGKSTFSRALELLMPDAASLRTDVIRRALKLHTTSFLTQPSAERELPYSLIEDAVRATLRHFPGQQFILDGTFDHYRCMHYSNLLHTLGANDHQVIHLIVSDPALHLQRVRTRRTRQQQRHEDRLPRLDYSTASHRQLADQLAQYFPPSHPLPVVTIDNTWSQADFVMHPELRESLELEHALWLLSEHFLEAREYLDKQ